jgi:SAM-dependent methyltransferase
VWQRALKALHRTIGPALPPTLLSRQYPGVPGRIHVDDLMLSTPTPGGLAHYVSDARSAIQNIEESLLRVGRRWTDVQACLDLPSGSGRVTRFLATYLRPERITACDLDKQAVRFCASEFGVEPLCSKPDLRDVVFPRTYDLIFVGSLLTHLTEDASLATLDALAHTLAPGGLLIFSTQGMSCLAHLQWYGARFAAMEHRYREQVEATGFCFYPYRANGRYGIAIQSREHVERVIGRLSRHLEFVRFAERGWDRHQDVWTYRVGP